ncbi:unnamed protein product [Brachionus calyciflorus]|uniref:Uncharacterized protein n=1 Tax=Brachionus calyciflorus TaxID=104777 RepID=A0A814HXY8_9BILA|nr:unnamed protein product [Brachionus calyciflorus]
MGFYVTLTSNSSMDLYPNNCLSEFAVRLWEIWTYYIKKDYNRRYDQSKKGLLDQNIKAPTSPYSSSNLDHDVINEIRKSDWFKNVPSFTRNDISRLDYPNGYSLFDFDLTPDLCSGDQFNLIRSGNLDLALTFSQSLDSSVVVIIYMEYDNLVEINNKYEVSYDYKI